MNREKKSSFLFCRTPLQSIIINQLLKETDGDIVVVYHATSISKKHQYYFNKINTEKKYFIPWNNSSLSQTWNDTIAWWKIPKKIRNKKYDVLYAASFINIVFSIIRGRNLKARLYTFDDGIGNLDTEANSIFWLEEPRNPYIVKRLFGGSSNKEILESIDRHYTIFNREKIFKWTSDIYELDLFNHHFSDENKENKTKVRILLGTWTNDPMLQKKYDNIIYSQKFDLFLPHPADSKAIIVSSKFDNLFNKEDLNNLIAEDAVNLLLSLGFRPVVYGFSSTSLINLQKIVPVINISILHLTLYIEIDRLLSSFGIHAVKL